MYGLLDLDGQLLAFDPAPAEPAAGRAYGATTITPMPIEPGRADAAGSKADGSVGGRSGKSHRIDVVAPGAIHVRVQQVNWPDLPQELPVVRIEQDRFQARTRGVLPAPGGQQTRVTVALVFVRATYADGQVVYHPPLDRTITYEEVAKFPSRPGLQPGSRRPRIVGKSTVITLAPPQAGTPDVLVPPDGSGTPDVTVFEDSNLLSGDLPSGGLPDTGLSPWVIGGAVTAAAGVLWWIWARPW